MGKDTTWLKRAVFLCAFFMVACTQQDVANEATNASVQAQNNVVANNEQSPLASLQELLSAADVKSALAQAAASNDKQTIEMWQQALLSAADEVYLAPQERALIAGSQGLQFLTFQGMKTNYQIAFERAFLEFGDVAQVYKEYPAFKNLHKRSMALVEQRDELVAKVREQLIVDGYEGDALVEARRQWQNFFLSQQSLSEIPPSTQTP